ncbi:hypothetical protein [Rhodococcus sp. 3-2]|uniref:hypothetical protein n=1 Tax=Rhodococcus sp. 3-2 TaxID=2890836 RepID=UPI001D18AB87|nr:hypothetical protein [Rhodococcus sp. 3-2]MCC4300441.1 hypothetical protein [Rhodococcus sp. 3-2]
MRRIFGVRYSDRWRFAEDGTRRLTLREIAVYLRDLPGDSSIVKKFNNGRPRWGDDTYLLSDLIHVMSGKPHPARPKPPKNAPDRRETPRRAAIRRKRIADRNRRLREMATATETTS